MDMLLAYRIRGAARREMRQGIFNRRARKGKQRKMISTASTAEYAEIAENNIMSR
jgi:hypothetical protein